MSLLLVVGGSGLLFLLAYLTYGRFLARKVFRLDDSRVTPAVEQNDGLDYVPAKKGMLLVSIFPPLPPPGRSTVRFSPEFYSAGRPH